MSQHATRSHPRSAAWRASPPSSTPPGASPRSTSTRRPARSSRDGRTTAASFDATEAGSLPSAPPSRSPATSGRGDNRHDSNRSADTAERTSFGRSYAASWRSAIGLTSASTRSGNASKLISAAGPAHSIAPRRARQRFCGAYAPGRTHSNSHVAPPLNPPRMWGAQHRIRVVRPGTTPMTGYREPRHATTLGRAGRRDPPRRAAQTDRP